MRMTVDLKSIDGKRDMTTTVDIDESQLQIPLGEVINLSLKKVEGVIRNTLGLAPDEVKKEEPKKEEPKVEEPAAQPPAPEAEVKVAVVGHPEPASTPPVETPAEAPPAAPAATEAPKSGGN